MSFSLGAAEQTALLFHLFSGSEIGEGEVQLRVFHVHVDPDQPFFLRQLHAGLDSVVKEVSDDAAQIDFRGFEPDRNMRVRDDLDVSGSGQ